MKNLIKIKKYQQSIIVTVLLVLIALSAIAGVGMFIMNNIEKSTETADFKLKASTVSFELKQAKINLTENITSFVVAAGEGKPDEFTRKANIIISNDAGQVQTFKTEDTFQPGESKEYTVGLQISNPTKIEIQPVIIQGDSEYVGSTTSFVEKGTSSNDLTETSETIIGTLDDGLVGYWSFNAGNYVDDSGNSRTGTCTAPACPSVAAGKIGNAFQFDSITEVINIPAIISLAPGTPFTLCSWVNPQPNSRHAGGYRTIMGYDSYHRLLIHSDGRMLSQQNGSFWSAADVPDGEWSQVIYWSNGIEERWYINGVQSGLDHTIPDAEWNLAFKIGQYTTNTYAFNGTIDEVRIYNRALTAEEITQLYSLR